MTTPPIVVASTISHQRMDRLRDLLGQIEREFGDLVEENAELRKVLADRGIPQPPPRQGSDQRSKSWIEHKGNYLTQLKSRITTQTPIEKKDWKFLREFLGHRDGVCEVSVSHTVEHLLGSASLDRTARVWTADDSAPTIVYVGHRGAVNSIRFHPRESLAITASGDGSCHIWRHVAADTEARMATRPPLTVPAAAEPWSPLLNPPRTAEPQSSTPMSASPPPVRRNEPSQRIVETAQQPLEHPEVAYAVPVRAPQQRLRGATGFVAAADWLAGGEQAASGGADNSLRIWAVETGACIAQVALGGDESNHITNITTLAASSLLATSSSDGYFRVFDLRSLAKPPSAAHAVLAHDGVVSTAVLVGGATMLVTGSEDKLVKVWDLRKDKTPLYSHRCSAAVNRLSVSPSGVFAAVPLDNRHTKICELTGTRVGQLDSHEAEGHRMAITSTAWSADQSVVYTSSFDRYRSVLAWSFSESKEDEREAREAAALAKKSASAAVRKAKREQKETKDAIKKQEKEAREVARKEQRERDKKEEQEKEKERRDKERQKEEKKEKDEKKPVMGQLGRSGSLGLVEPASTPSGGEKKRDKKEKTEKKS